MENKMKEIQDKIELQNERLEMMKRGYAELSSSNALCALVPEAFIDDKPAKVIFKHTKEHGPVLRKRRIAWPEDYIMVVTNSRGGVTEVPMAEYANSPLLPYIKKPVVKRGYN